MISATRARITCSVWGAEANIQIIIIIVIVRIIIIKVHLLVWLDGRVIILEFTESV